MNNEIRPEIEAFAREMERVFMFEFGKGNLWRDYEVIDLFDLMKSEVQTLELILCLPYPSPDAILGKIVDVAKFGVMIADVLDLLDYT